VTYSNVVKEKMVNITKTPKFAACLRHTKCPTCGSLVWTVWTGEHGQFCEFCALPGTVVKSLREINDEREKEDNKKRRQ
jgi:hypothetical protein